MEVDYFTHYLMLLPGAILALMIHESVKAHCSARQGDPTPKRYGFLSGNPFKYIEPVGLFCMVVFGYGWGQPVPTSPMYYKDRRKGLLVTYITPSVVNLLLGVILAILVGVLNTVLSPLLLNPSSGVAAPDLLISAVRVLFRILYLFARCNVAVALFNLLPVYPMDCAKILQLFLPPGWAVKLNQYEKILQIILMLLLGMGFIGMVFDPLIDLILNTVW